MNRGLSALTLWFLLASPVEVSAHSALAGGNALYEGMLHPVFVPAHLLLLIALGLFLGQQGPERNQAALLLFSISTILGLIVAWLFVSDLAVEPYLLCAAAIFGLLVAANCSVIKSLILTFATLAGLTLGMDSAQQTLSGLDRLIALIGSAVGIMLLIAGPLLVVDNINKNKPWQHIGVRIVGSWVAASALMILALSLSQNNPSAKGFL